ncbi:MAG: CopD family protein [Gammaproteobacteria bacterium]
MYGMLLFFHILAATVWTGGHLILATTILPRALRGRSVDELLRFESAFERIGIPALLIQVVTGLLLAQRMIPDIGQWLDFDSPFSRLIGTKLILLLLTIALAVHARLRVIPRLSQDRLTVLAWHVIPVTVISVLFVLVGVSFRTGWFW